ncbi:MAG: hypothetical protein J6J44_04970 [Lachnospiraceae bacterium]|nr:hypothetical protein [Lachnospiraceae bacterium]
MGRFEVRIDILEQLAGREKDIASEVAAISSNVSGTLRRMTQEGVVSSSIRNRLKDAIRSISECQSEINKMGNTLESCAEEYQQTERKMLLLGLQQQWMENGEDGVFAHFLGGGFSAIKGNSQSEIEKYLKYLHTLQPAGMTTLAGLCKLAEIGRESTTNEIEKENDYSVRDEAIGSLYDYAAGAGYIGALSSFVGRIVGGQITKDPNEEFDEDEWHSESLGTLKGGFSMMKTLSKWQTGNEELAKLAKYAPNWAKEEKIARLFGMTDAMGGTASTAGSWGARFAENVSKQDGILDDFSKGGSKTFFAYAGVVVDFAMNANENYEEYMDGEIGAGRAFFETVTETTVDFAVDWGIGVAVTAALAATPIGAPVLLVGACTVGAKFLLDWGSEKLFGKDFTEVVSDTIVDVAAGTLEVASDVVKTVGEFVEETGKAVGDAICKGTQKVVSGVGNAIKDGWESAKAGFSSIGQGFKSLLAW